MDTDCDKKYRANFAGHQQFQGEIDGKRCVVPISVGQHYVEGEKFKALMQLINAHFSSCDVIVIDLLQRHTLRLQQNLDYRGCWGKAVELGGQWLERNQAAIDSLTIPHRVRAWHEWLYGVSYLKQRKLIDYLYQTHPDVRQAFDESAANFTRRYVERYPHLKDFPLQVADVCMQYVREECSVMPLWVNEGYNYEVYAGKRIPGMVAIYELLVKPRHRDLLRWLRVNMRSVKQSELAV
ncbi:MAG: hypothetical protein P1U34_09545 [Coxiellaceae bacterium]|nr:hypothetical protein [Coxiellaceae bacterium]